MAGAVRRTRRNNSNAWAAWTGLAACLSTLAVGVYEDKGAQRETPVGVETRLCGKSDKAINLAPTGSGLLAYLPTVRDGRVRLRAPLDPSGDRLLLILSSLATTQGPFEAKISVQAGDPPVTSYDDAASAIPLSRVDPLARVGESLTHHRFRTLKHRDPTESTPSPPARRIFHLLVKDGDVASASNYRATPAHLKALGRYAQVYVDENDLSRVGSELLEDVVRTFDETMAPELSPTLGLAADVDGDGRFTVLVSSWLEHLADGRYNIDGYVRAADFDDRLGAPFSNHCDMLYLNSRLKAGKHLHTILAHEYTHAITLRHKSASPTVCNSDLASAGPRTLGDEEGWLDEGLAHLVEDRFGFSKSNIDYRVSAYLTAPERFRLVVADYYAADLFRSHGNRGGTFLFLKYCSDRFGPGVIDALIRSPLKGVVNVEAATGVDFAELYRDWTLATACRGLGIVEEREDQGYCVSGEFGDRTLAGPTAEKITLSKQFPSVLKTLSLEGTTTHYLTVSTRGLGSLTIEVSAASSAKLQATVVPLPSNLAQIELDCKVGADSGDRTEIELGRLSIEHRGGGRVTLEVLAWESLSSPNGYCSGRLTGEGLEQLLGCRVIEAGRKLEADAGRVPGFAVSARSGPVVLKLLGRDEQNRRVCASRIVSFSRAENVDLDDQH